MNSKAKVAIIDSGVYLDHPTLKNAKINGFALNYDEKTETICFSNFYDDVIGHGTAVASIIYNIAPEAEITVIKVLDDELSISPVHLQKVLEYISENCSFDIINMSFGIVEYEEIGRIEELCNRLIENDTIIISAFDNTGAISFPAAFQNVIGVDSSLNCKKRKEWEYVENSIVNIRGIGAMQRIAWKNPLYVVTNGNSMTCACITGYATDYILKQGLKSNVLNYFRQNAVKIYENKQKEKYSNNTTIDNFERTAVFPVSKETQAFFRYPDLAMFKLVKVYDIRLSGRVGKSLYDLIKTDTDVSKLEVEDIENIDYGCFDTLVIGHYSKINVFLKDKDSIQKIISNAVNLGKRVFLFDPPRNEEWRNNPLIFFPQDVFVCDIRNNFKKLYYISKPILAVAGTSSKQGKFSFQLEMKRRFQNNGYNIGGIGTEPHSELFGFNKTFACGFESRIGMSLDSLVQVVNEMLWEIMQIYPDIIIVGLQAGLIPQNCNDLRTYPLVHQIFLQGVRPDALFLCFNPDDDFYIVNNCIKTAEGLSGGKVIGLVCFPKILEKRWVADINHYKLMSLQTAEKLKQQFEQYFKLPVYMLDNKEDMDAAYNDCVSFFS